MAIASDVSASVADTRSALPIWSLTGRRLVKEYPKSPRATFPIQLAYWTASGRSRPYFALSPSTASASMARSETRARRIDRAGSASLRYGSAKQSTDTASSVRSRTANLRAMKGAMTPQRTMSCSR